MKENLKKFMELVEADENLQAKLEEAGRNYTGEQTEEAAFESIIAPIAKDAGLPITFEDIRQSVQELDLDEMGQVAGGENPGKKKRIKPAPAPAPTESAPDGSGFGGGVCQVIGVGALGAFTSQGGVICLAIGGGWGGKSICFQEGSSE